MVAKAKKKQNATAIHCDHCGAELPQSKVVENDKQFCCNGCSSVYAILKAGGLCEYYKISQTPGTINKTTVSFSDEELELLESHFVIGEGPDKTEILLHIPGMHCSSCIWLLEKLAALDNGIAGSRANFVQKQLRILYNKEKTSFGRIIKLLKSIGYEPSLMPEKERAAKSNSNIAILIKMGVAGFCAGNTMMFSFPQYLGLNTEAPNTFSTLFDSLNVLLSLPVVFYCGGEYLTAFYHWISKGLLSVKVPLAIGICSLWLRSLYEILSQTGPGYFDSLTGLVFFLLIGSWLQNKTFDSLRFGEKTRNFFPLIVQLIKEGKTKSVKIADIGVGSRLLIRHNEIIPSDSILMTSSTTVDYSFATGESTQICKVAGEILYAGGRNKGGSIEVEIIKVFEESRLAEAWNVVGSDKPGKVLFFEKRISLYFIFTTLALAITTLVFWLFVNPGLAWFSFIAVLMVACPCALALAPPFAYNTISNYFARNGFFVKKPEVIGVLGDVKTMVIDKTGTITNPNKFLVNISNEYKEEQRSILYSLAEQSNHPYSVAIAEATQTRSVKTRDFIENPGQGISCVWQDQTIKLGSAKWLGINDPSSNDKQIWFSIGNVVLKPIKFSSNITNEVALALKKMRNQGIKLVLSSGDQSQVVEALIDQTPGVFAEVFSEQTPLMKKETVRKQKQKGTVIMLGDGLNDAGALSEADAGIVVTSNTNNFTPEASAILLKEKVELLPRFLRVAAKANHIVKETFILSLVYNMAALILAASGKMTPLTAAILMPSSSIFLMLFAWLRAQQVVNKNNIE